MLARPRSSARSRRPANPIRARLTHPADCDPTRSWNVVAAPATTWRGRTAIVKAGRAGNRGRLRARVAGVAAPRPPSEHCSIPGWLPPTRRAFHELHVWLHKKNPSGLFAPFNPNVSC